MIAVVVWFASSAWAVVLLKRVLTPDDLTGAVIDATFAQLLCGFIGAAVYVRACEKEDGDGGVAVATGAGSRKCVQRDRDGCDELGGRRRRSLTLASH